MQLSPNFHLKEFTKSQIATKLGIDNTPPDAVIDNLKRLCVEVLEPIRAFIMAPLYITSGYRCRRLNDILRGSPAHLTGRFCDFECPVVRPKMLMYTIHAMKHILPIEEAGLEFDEWIHIGVHAIGIEPKRELWVARHKHPGVEYVRFTV